MEVKAISTKVFQPPQADLEPELERVVTQLPDHSVLAVTSKVVSIAEGRCVAKDKFPDKDELIKQEADHFLPRRPTPHSAVIHTLRQGRLCGSAGVDESNSDGYYILLPMDPWQSARWILAKLQTAAPEKTLAVVIVDSISTPLRRGALGSALAFAGFNPVKSYSGEEDIFGRLIRWGRVNVADALAVAANLELGEGRETTPLAVITGLDPVLFRSEDYRPEEPYASFQVPPAEDMFGALLLAVDWLPGGGGYRTEYQVDRIEEKKL